MIPDVISVISDCRLTERQLYLIPREWKVSNPSPVYGCECTACENGRAYSKRIRDLIGGA